MSLILMEDSMTSTQSQADLGGKVSNGDGKPRYFNNDITEGEIEKRFGPYRKPTDVTIPRFKAIQEKTLELAKLIDQLCPTSKEKSTALTALVTVKMSANAAIAVNLN